MLPFMSTSERTAQIEAFITENVDKHAADIAHFTALHFGITRQAVHRHLVRLVRENKLTAVGTTRSRTYALPVLTSIAETLKLEPALAEDRVWDKYIAPHVRDLPENIREICFYGFTEMLNNAKDHSESPNVTIALNRDPKNIKLTVIDDGIGIFHKLATTLHLDDERHAILELSKGKLTTDPTRHSGEGIFFTSRMFDRFAILSGRLRFLCNDGADWLMDTNDTGPDEYSPYSAGTSVLMVITTNSKRTSKEVFDRFAGADQDYGFTRTHVPVVLAKYGTENLVSRSQAKRLLARFERFKEVVLDFNDVPMIGQAFADEVFRVFQNHHPDVRLYFRNAVPDVERMIRRALAKAKEDANE
jgi:anti-sigma regulatory factor (Ser/Thr protein kinase)